MSCFKAAKSSQTASLASVAGITSERSPEAHTDRFDYVLRDRSNARGGERESIFHVPDDTPSTELRQKYLVCDRDTKSSTSPYVLCVSLKV